MLLASGKSCTECINIHYSCYRGISVCPTEICFMRSAASLQCRCVLIVINSVYQLVPYLFRIFEWWVSHTFNNLPWQSSYTHLSVTFEYLGSSSPVCTILITCISFVWLEHKRKVQPMLPDLHAFCCLPWSLMHEMIRSPISEWARKTNPLIHSESTPQPQVC